MASLLAAHAAIGAWLLVRRARGPCAAATTEAAASAPPPPSPPTSPPSVELAEALALDASDELATLRRHFEMPAGVNVYLCGHSLGLMPAPAAALVREELDLWLRLGERGHFTGPNWLSYHERVRAPLARLVGASSLEVVAMNSLTVNLHLLMASFYNPSNSRFKIVIEAGAFPSDRIAVRSHAALRGYDAASAIVELRPRDGRDTLETADVLAYIAERGHEVALFLLAGVQYYSGQLFEIGPITAAARAQGCAVGWDLAHAVGNVPLRLHEWGVDFAAWCSYKYLNGARGARARARALAAHWPPRADLCRCAPPRRASRASRAGRDRRRVRALAALRTRCRVERARAAPARRLVGQRPGRPLSNAGGRFRAAAGRGWLAALQPADPAARGAARRARRLRRGAH